jgi:hypothetical protein
MFDLADFVGYVILVGPAMMRGMAESLGGDSNSADVKGWETLGTVILIGSTILRIVDAGNTANDTNRDLRKKYGLEVGIRNNLPVLQYSCGF